MKRTGPQAQIQTNEEIQATINDLTADTLKEVFLRLDWAKFATIGQVSTFWHSLVAELSQNLIRTYFPYLASLPAVNEPP